MALKHNGVEVKIESILDDATYPTSKRSLIEFARSVSDGDDVIDILNNLENRTYETQKEVQDELQDLLTRKKGKGKKRHVIGDDEEIWSK